MTRREAIPLAGATALRPLAKRTRTVRLAAAAGLLVLALTAILLSRNPRVHELAFLPQGSNGIVVLDLSASISEDTYSRIGATLRTIASSRGRYGLVIFSDTAYEALPPGSPAEAFRPLIRYFVLPEQKAPGIAPSFPVNPWTKSFSAGTKISTGLELARSILIDERLTRPAVLLVSDLDDDPADLPRLTSIALALRNEHVPLHVVGLNPSVDDERLFRRLAGDAGSFSRARIADEQAAGGASGSFPVWLATIAVALAAALAANEIWGARLTWSARPARAVEGA